MEKRALYRHAITSKYSGWCRVCKEDYCAGDKIYYTCYDDSSTYITHTKCPVEISRDGKEVRYCAKCKNPFAVDTENGNAARQKYCCKACREYVAKGKSIARLARNDNS